MVDTNQIKIEKENGKNRLVFEENSQQYTIAESTGTIVWTLSPNREYVLAILTSEKKAVMYSLKKKAVILEIPIDNLYSIEYAWNEDGSKVAVAVSYSDNKSKLYKIENCQLVEEKDFDGRISIERENDELKVKNVLDRFLSI